MKPNKFSSVRWSKSARHTHAVSLFAAGALLTLGGSLKAQTTYTYTGSATGALDNAANYSPSGTAPTSTTAGVSDTILFNGSNVGGATALTLTNTTANFGGTTGGSAGVLFNVDGAQTASVNIANTATIRLAGLTIASGAGAVTFSGTGGYNVGGLGTATTNSFTNNSSNTLTISGNLQAGGSGQRTLGFAGTGTGAITVSGQIGSSAPNIVLQKDSSALLTLSGANAYTGTTNLNAGITRISNATALGTTAAGTAVASGATLQLQGGITVGAEALTLSGTGAAGGAGALENLSGTNSYGGAVTLAANATIAADNGTTLTLTSGTAIAGGGFTVSLVGSGTGTVNAGIATGSGGLIKTGTGTWTLGGTSTYTGATAVSAGTLLVNGSTGTSAVSVTNSGTILGGTGTVGGVVTVNNGAVLQGGVGAATGILTLTSTPVLNAGSVIGLTLGTGNAHSTLALAAGGFNGFQTNQSFTLSGLQVGTYDNIITGVAANISTSGWTVLNATGYSYSFSDDGSNIDLVVTAVPEPSTWVAGLICLVAVTGVWRQRRQAR